MTAATTPAPLACRECGCTDDDCSRCIEKAGAPCRWVEVDLCSACVPVPEVDVRLVAVIHDAINDVRTGRYERLTGGALTGSWSLAEYIAQRVWVWLSAGDPE